MPQRFIPIVGAHKKGPTAIGTFHISTVCNRCCGKVMFFTSVCQEFCPQEGVVYPIACWDTHPLGQIPPARHTMGRHPQTPPFGRHTLLAERPLGRHPRRQTSTGQKPPSQTAPLAVTPFPLTWPLQQMVSILLQEM